MLEDGGGGGGRGRGRGREEGREGIVKKSINLSRIYPLYVYAFNYLMLK